MGWWGVVLCLLGWFLCVWCVCVFWVWFGCFVVGVGCGVGVCGWERRYRRFGPPGPKQAGGATMVGESFFGPR
ncbi:hypothetical protein, partial [Pseudomonas syringae group genomosp. 7]|uniref:hypothetical protein n=1 Tax=Pseudomonas syringae group genomosp. 7 TaxID=251699 RepID=UPI00376FB43B